MISPVAWTRSYLEGEHVGPVGAMFGLNFVDELDNATYTWLAPTILADFHRGVGTGSAIFVLASVVAPLIAMPFARRGDRGRRMPLVIGAAVVWAVFSLLTGLAPLLWILVAARVGATFGRTVSYPVAAGLMADFYPAKVLNKSMGLFTGASQAGDAIGPLLGAGAAAIFGWRGAFVFIAIVSIPIVVAAARVKDPVRGAFSVPVEVAVEIPVREAFQRLWAIKSYRMQCLAGIWVAAGVLGAKLIVPFFFKDDFGIGTFGLGVVGSVAGFGALLTSIKGASLAQRALDESPAEAVRWLVRLAWVITGISAAFAVAPTVWIAVPILFVLACAAGLVAPLVLTLVAVVSPPELRSRAQAIQAVVALAGVVPLGVVAGVSAAVDERAGFAVAAVLLVVGIRVFSRVALLIDADVAAVAAGEAPVVGFVPCGPDVLLETRAVTVSFDGTQVLFGVDLHVDRGEIVALLGTNGAGKSTILNAVCGLVAADGGTVWFDGEVITGQAAERTARRGLVMAPGGRGIFPGLTVAENLRLGAYLLRGDKPLAASRIADALEVFPALRPLMEISAGSLSGGQRQMLVLAQAFLLKPQLLLIDELSLGLAPVIVSDLLEAVRRLNAEGIAIVLVEQSVNVALTLADRAYFLEKGQVRFSGPTADLLGREDLLRSVFLRGAGAAIG